MSGPEAVRAQTRDEMVAGAMRTGLSREQASVLTDISKHAFDEAFAAARRVIDTAPDELKAATFTSVLASFATIMRERFPEHWEAFVAVPVTPDRSTVITLPDRPLS